MGTEEKGRKKKKQMRKLWKKKKEREEKRGGEVEKRRKKIKRKTESAAQKMYPPPPPRNAFPSQKLGNNITPIKGRLGKNTTPTHGDPKKLIERRQRNPSEDSRTSSIHPVQTSSTHYEKQNIQKRRAQRQQNPHL